MQATILFLEPWIFFQTNNDLEGSLVEARRSYQNRFRDLFGKKTSSIVLQSSDDFLLGTIAILRDKQHFEAMVWSIGAQTQGIRKEKEKQ